MISSRDSSSVTRAWRGLNVRTASGIVQARTVYVRDASNVSRSVLASLAAMASPSQVSGYAFMNAATTITTSQTTVTATGASAPTYAWTGPGGGWTITSPTSATTSFKRASVGGGQSFDGTFVCTVTDGTQTATVSVTATVANNYNA